jgi:hypothetical protein
MKYFCPFFIFHSSFFIEFCEAKFLWASRFASLASGYPLHHPLRAFGTLRVVPLLSLSLLRRSAANEKSAYAPFKILKNQCYLCAYVPKISLCFV